MLRRMDLKEANELFATNDENIYFQALEDMMPWARAGEYLEVQHATDGGVTGCELAVVHVAGKYLLETRPALRIWDNQERAIGSVIMVFSTPNADALVRLRKVEEAKAERQPIAAALSR